MNIAVLASGSGSNFEAIAKAVKTNYIKACLKVLITDNEKAFVRVRAKRFGIKDIFVNPKHFSSRVSFDKHIAKILKNEKINLVVLAGYMRVLSPYFVRQFQHQIMNIHPALLPAFKGTGAIERAYRYGCKITGVTVHFVDEKVDHGPIIVQGHVVRGEGMRLEELEKRVHKLEHILYPLAIKLYVERKLKIKGRNVKII
ncbi:MAG: phosphoribosylglycinamide formyltransferase [Candidatus Omnitrophota bacterium]|nr:MAG: phosphoribosylglycinamide formyltransferase [Candidatus Omnitrophota bacterium]